MSVDIDDLERRNKSGETSAGYALGIFFESDATVDEAEEAIKINQLSAQKGYINAWVRLGKIRNWERFKGTTIFSPEKALMSFTKAAEGGSPEGAFHAGMIWMSRITCPDFFMQAFRLFEMGTQKSAHEDDQGKSPTFIALCHHKLGDFFFHGWAFPSDFPKALEHYLQGFSKDKDSNPYREIGIIYLRGLGTPRDPKKAQEFLQRGKAWEELGIMYEQGLGVPVDLGKAIFHYSKGAGEGAPCQGCQLALARLMFEGKTTLPLNRVAGYLLRSARHKEQIPNSKNRFSFPEAAFLMGQVCESGVWAQEIPLCLSEAYAWYKVASQYILDEPKKAAALQKLHDLKSKLPNEEVQKGETKFSRKVCLMEANLP